MAVSEISQPQHGHGFRSTGMIGLISLVWSAEALALGPSFVTDPTVDHRRTDNSIAIERENGGGVETYLDYIRNTEDDQWDGVYGFRPTSGHSPYYFSAAFSRSDGKGSGTKLTLDKFNLDVASSRIHAVYSTANNPTERGAIQANDLIINANNGFLIAAQSYATSGTEGAVVVLNNLDVKKGYIILVNGPAQGVGKLAIGNRLYIGPNSWFRPLNLTGSTTGSVHSGNQTGYLRTKILDLFGQFQANETFNESNRQFIRTSTL